MNPRFRKSFLVCLDLEEDVNYVLSRSFTLETARRELSKIRDAGQEAYITYEYVITNSALNPCGCPDGPGACKDNNLCVCSSSCPCKDQLVVEEEILENSEEEDLELEDGNEVSEEEILEPD